MWTIAVIIRIALMIPEGLFLLLGFACPGCSVYAMAANVALMLAWIVFNAAYFRVRKAHAAAGKPTDLSSMLSAYSFLIVLAMGWLVFIICGYFEPSVTSPPFDPPSDLPEIIGIGSMAILYSIAAILLFRQELKLPPIPLEKP